MVSLDPTLPGTSQTETEERPVKRPRVGSVSSNITRTQLEVSNPIDQRASDIPHASSDDETHCELDQPRLPAWSSSEFGPETDAESSANPHGSPVAQTLDNLGQRQQFDFDSHDDTFVPGEALMTPGTLF